MTFRELFEANRILFYCLSGQIFFVLGIVIAVRIRRDVEIPLARPLWFLSAFGVLHGFYEWSYVVLPVQAAYLQAQNLYFLQLIQRPLEALSFFFLFQSGVAFIRLSSSVRWIEAVPLLLLGLYMIGYIHGLPPQTSFKLYSNTWDLWARYLLCLPGALAAAYGLYSLLKREAETGISEISGSLRGACFAFLVYAVAAGLMVPPADFFPASWLNRSLLSVHLGVPPQFVRALAGVLIGYFVIRSLSIFEIGVRRLLDDAIEVRAIARDRERIGRDLHDGMLQVLYGTGLVLKNAVAIMRDDADEGKRLVQESIKNLERCMTDIRRYVLDLNRTTVKAGIGELKSLVEDIGQRHGLETHFSVTNLTNRELGGELTLELYHFMHEALMNVTKHACARNVRVDLTRRDNELDLAIADDGIGFTWCDGAHREPQERHGLKNMGRRAELLSGSMSIDTAVGRGTRVTLVLPLPGAHSK